MPTTSVNTIGSGGDYATLVLWEADTDNDLVAADIIERGEFLDQAHTVAGNVNIGGATVDATRFRQLTKVSGANLPGKIRGVGIVVSLSGFVRQEEAFCQIFDLEFDATGLGTEAIGPRSHDGLLVERVLIYDGDSRGIRCGVSVNLQLINVCVLNCDSGGIHTTAVTSAEVYNCATMNSTNVGGHGLNTASSGTTVKNHTSFGNGGDAFEGGGLSGTSSFDFCACDDTSITDTSPGGSNNLEGLTAADQVEVLTPGSENFAVKGGADILDAGTDLTSQGVTTDISGISRPQGLEFDMGAAEAADPPAPQTGPTMDAVGFTQGGQSFSTGSSADGEERIILTGSGRNSNFIWSVVDLSTPAVYMPLYLKNNESKPFVIDKWRMNTSVGGTMVVSLVTGTATGTAVTPRATNLGSTASAPNIQAIVGASGITATTTLLFEIIFTAPSVVSMGGWVQDGYVLDPGEDIIFTYIGAGHAVTLDLIGHLAN